MPTLTSNIDKFVTAKRTRQQMGRSILYPLIALSFLNSGCSDGNPSATVVSGEFSALAYNVAGLPQPLSGSNPETNMPIISPLLNNYDLVLVQEDWLTPLPNGLAPLRVYHAILAGEAEHPYQSTPAPLPLSADPSRPSALVSDGLNRFSQFPFGDIVRQAWAGCDNNSGDCLALKGFSVARTALAEGVCVDVYNIHGEAGNDAGDRALKDDNTRDIAGFIEVFSAGRAVIIGGDFNQRRSRAHDADNLDYLTTNTGLANACDAVGVVDDEAIDKFFFRSSEAVTLNPTSCQFEIDTFITTEGGPLSDHDPLAVSFSWSAQTDATLDCL